MFVRPNEIVHSIGMEPGMVIADFGAGSGHYSIASASAVGSTGKVYAIDIQKDLLGTIKSNAEVNNLSNVNLIWADLEMEKGSRLANDLVDIVMISNILFQVDNKESVAKEAFRILKEGGKAAVIEWDKKVSKIGPPLEKRVKKEDCLKIFKDIGFKKEKEFKTGENHYGLLFSKPYE